MSTATVHLKAVLTQDGPGITIRTELTLYDNETGTFCTHTATALAPAGDMADIVAEAYGLDLSSDRSA